MEMIEKKVSVKLILIVGFMIITSLSYSQINSIHPELIKPDPAKEQKFLPYLAVRHGGLPNIETWKNNNTVQYYKELWYYSESFYIKRNHLEQGVTMDESMIDITRFENSRKENEEVVIVMPGFKDAIILLPTNKLIYKPQ